MQFLSFRVWDVDFWWHIATGREIISSGALSQTDLFSYTTILEENKNPFPDWETFVLKQYWLGQIILFSVFDYFGSEGIVIFRSLMLILTAGTVFLMLKRWSISLPASFICIFVVLDALLAYTGERPVLITIFFAALTFFLLEDYSQNRKKRILLLVPVMLLWSNIHGGYIIGIIIISLFTAGEIADSYLKKAVYKKGEIYLLAGVSLISVLTTFVNPNGWQAILISFNIPFKYKAIHTNITEYFSPFYLYRNKIHPPDYLYLLLVILSTAIIILRNRKMRISHLMILAAFCLMSLSALRMVVYFILAGSLIIARETDLWAKGIAGRHMPELRAKGLSALLIVGCFVSAILYFSNKTPLSGFRIADSVTAPVKAADFIEKNRISGNMFNDYSYGGYLAWRLYPGHKTFIDSRTLNINVRKEYEWIVGAQEMDSRTEDGAPTKKQLWELLLRHYNINIIILKVTDPFYQIHPLIFKLIEGQGWRPVYSDHESVIFLRNNESNERAIEQYGLPAEEVFNTIISQSASGALRNETNPISLISLGDVFYKMNRLEEARKSYSYALERMPGNISIQQKIIQTDAEMEKRREDK